MTVGNMLRDTEKSCEDFEPFIDTYIDEEFGERERAEMEAHLSICDACREQVRVQMEFKQHVREQLRGETAPEALRERILSGIEEAGCESEDISQQDDASEQPAAGSGRNWSSLARVGWVAAPVAAAVVAVLVLPEFTVAPAASNPAPVIDHTVDWHQGNFPLEVTTDDTDEAREWFQDKVDFSVQIPEFDDENVNLLGGRIAHIEDQRAAFVLYEVDGARLSAILFDGDGVTVPRDRLRRIEDRDIAWLNQQGYGVALVQDSGVTYAMTSDLSEDRFLGLVAESVDN